MTPADSVSGSDRRVYARRPRQLLIAGSLLGIFLATLSMVLEPDPSTGIKPLPGDYLWVVIPGAIMLAVLVRRAFRARIQTDAGGVELVRVAGHERLPWSDIRGFEVHPTPSRQGFAVRARRHNEALVTLRNEINVRPLRDRDEARRRARERAATFKIQLDADRTSRLPSGRGASASTSG
ncbi:MAG: PH domain-containing protein [Actinomycetota bacterium]|nr:PH domain-containing protein [Actinomycetota bacterium]MDQ6944916.1 PH domain-containing protein [Actinomycetota bacterium]